MKKRQRQAQQKAQQRQQTDRRWHGDPCEVERAQARHQRQHHSLIRIRDTQPHYPRHLGLCDRCKGDYHDQVNTDHPPVIRTRRAP